MISVLFRGSVAAIPNPVSSDGRGAGGVGWGVGDRAVGDGSRADS